MMNDQLDSVRGWRMLGTLPAAATIFVAFHAIYILLVAFTNITDYETNLAFAQHVLAMDTTNFGAGAGVDLDQQVIWRAITTPWMWHAAYIGIIAWETLTGILLLIGTIWLIRGFRRRDFTDGRLISSIGLVMIVVLFGIGFITVGGEWFQMWRSTDWNGLTPALGNVTTAAIALVLLHLPSAQWQSRARKG